MKHLKMLALAAVALAAVMAFIGAGSASATVICSTTIETCPTAQKWGNIPIDLSLVKGTTSKLTETNGTSIIQCSESTIKADITNTGSSTETVSGPVTEWTWAGCNLPTKTLKTGSLEIHWIAGTSNGTVTVAKGTNFEFTINTIIFGSCVFKAEEGTDLGTLEEGKPGTFTAKAATFKSSGICPASSLWNATYVVTTPENTTLSVSPKTD